MKYETVEIFGRIFKYLAKYSRNHSGNDALEIARCIFRIIDPATHAASAMGADDALTELNLMHGDDISGVYYGEERF